MRRLENYVRKYGPTLGPAMYHAHQSQAARAGVSARLRRKIGLLTGKAPAAAKKKMRQTILPLFTDTEPVAKAETSPASQDATIWV
ncbi:hypothetical protein [Singulisphaera sp. PoT]|uniref:hypothetical protein n=1 Tax=Singulisphaera sp. PoT TaxID=3411797 RepID=UPI003BF5714F